MSYQNALEQVNRKYSVKLEEEKEKTNNLLSNAQKNVVGLEDKAREFLDTLEMACNHHRLSYSGITTHDQQPYCINGGIQYPFVEQWILTNRYLGKFTNIKKELKTFILFLNPIINRLSVKVYTGDDDSRHSAQEYILDDVGMMIFLERELFCMCQ